MESISPEQLGSFEVTSANCKDSTALNEAIHRLCQTGDVDKAQDLLFSLEEAMEHDEYRVRLNQSLYVIVINALGREGLAERCQDILQHMKSISETHECCTPKGQAYSAVIWAWSNSKDPNGANRADALLTELWEHFNCTQDRSYIPTRATYASTISAWARCARSKDAAERAEELLEEMESYRELYPLLGPTTACVNAVL